MTNSTDFQRGQTAVADQPPTLLTVDEVAGLLRTSRKAIYAMVERGQLPGVTRIGRRVLVKRSDLLRFLDHNGTPLRR
jgi:excisionase family DNA binding protein